MVVVILCQQYDVEEKSTIILYTQINRHAGTPNRTKTINAMSLDYSLFKEKISTWEDQFEWHRMTRMTGPDCAVVFKEKSERI